MRLSVCIPAHDEAAGIADTIGDVLASELGTHELLEVLVYDDASTDATADVVRRIAARHPLVQLHRGRSRAGMATAVNTLYRLAHGDVIIKLCADVRLARGALRRLADAIAAGATTASAVGDWSAARWTPVALGAAFAMAMNRTLSREPVDGLEYAPGRCVALEAGFARALLIPGDVIAEDRFTTRRAISAGGTAVLLDDARCRHWVPTSFADYRAQSARVRRGEQHLEQAYGAQRRPLRSRLSAFAREAVRDPVGAACWMPIYLATLLMPPAPNSPAWQKTATTKGTT